MNAMTTDNRGRKGAGGTTTWSSSSSSSSILLPGVGSRPATSCRQTASGARGGRRDSVTPVRRSHTTRSAPAKEGEVDDNDAPFFILLLLLSSAAEEDEGRRPNPCPCRRRRPRDRGRLEVTTRPDVVVCLL